MSDEVIGLKVEIDKDGNLDKATQRTKTFKQQMRDLQEQLLSLAAAGKEGTAEYNALLNKLADGKDKMKDLTEAMNLANPGEKANAFKLLGTTIVGGFQAATGALAVFTGDNDELNKILLKSMAIIQGLQGLQAIVDVKKQAGVIKNIFLKKQEVAATVEATAATEGEAVATEGASLAFQVLKGAIIATGIGALVVALGLLVANWGTVSAWINKVTDNFGFLKTAIDKVRDGLSFITGGMVDDAATHKLKAAIDDQTAASKKAYDQMKDNHDLKEQDIRQMEIEGESLKDITEKKKELIDAEIKTTQAYINGLEAKVKNKTASDDEIQTLQQLKKEHATLVNDGKDLEKGYTDAVKKESNERTQKYEDEFNNAKKNIENLRIELMDEGAQKDLAKAEQHAKDLMTNLFGTPEQREIQKQLIEQELAKTKKEIEDKYSIDPIGPPKEEDKQAFYNSLNDKISHVADTWKKMEEGKNASRALDEKDEQDHQEKLNKIIEEAANLSNEIGGAVSDMMEARRNNELAAAGGNQAKQEQINRKYFEDNKKLQESTAIINGLVAITKIAADVPKADFGIATAIMIGAQIASTAATVAKIKSTQYSGSGSGGGVPVATAAPTFNTIRNQINKNALATQQGQQQAQQNSAGSQPPVRTYVLDHDIALSQQRMDKIAKLSTH